MLLVSVSTGSSSSIGLPRAPISGSAGPSAWSRSWRTPRWRRSNHPSRIHRALSLLMVSALPFPSVPFTTILFLAILPLPIALANRLCQPSLPSFLANQPYPTVLVDHPLRLSAVYALAVPHFMLLLPLRTIPAFQSPSASTRHSSPCRHPCTSGLDGHRCGGPQGWIGSALTDSAPF